MDNFVLAPCLAYQAGLSSFISQNIGASEAKRVHRGLKSTIIMTVVTSLIISSTLFIFAEPIAGLFGLTYFPLMRAVEQIRFLAVFFTLFAMFTSVSGVLQGAGDVLVLSIVSALSLLIRVSTAYFGVYAGILSYEAAWVTTPISWSFTLTILCIRYWSGRWKKKAIAGGLETEEHKLEEG